ncbi:FkbM family methyltransferase [Tardiphaga sp.]|uniref:FkbM family methyltransferase n=1 Tax=Tardiphaga sp. TaxID=1926292 RepID=UPI0037D9AEF9
MKALFRLFSDLRRIKEFELRQEATLTTRLPFGQQKIIDRLSRTLDEIEKTWPMTGSYERIDPYIVPMMQGARFDFIIYHKESRSWFDQVYHDFIVGELVRRQLVKPGMVAFDLGCNSGALTAPLAMLAGPTGHVHSFDPYPWNAAATLANAHINYFDNVTAHAVGLSNKSFEINVSPNDSRIYAASEATNSQRLIIKDIREYMHLKPQFLKVDIEGAEHELFDVGPDVFAGVELVALEFHPMWIAPRGIDCRDSLRNIQKSGFGIHYHSVDAGPYPIDSYNSNHHMFWLKRAAA